MPGSSQAASTAKPPWRNRLARSAVNRKVGGSSPPGGAKIFFFCFDPGRIRTCNLLIRSQTRYPLRHWATLILNLSLEANSSSCFRSVVVITCASHAQGPRFDPGRKQGLPFLLLATAAFWPQQPAGAAKDLQGVFPIFPPSFLHDLQTHNLRPKILPPLIHWLVGLGV